LELDVNLDKELELEIAIRKVMTLEVLL
jgi:hypothetical protein